TIKRQPSDVAAPLSEAYTAAEEASETSLLTIEDNSSSQYPDALNYFPTFSYANAIRIGDSVSAAGPLNYSFGTYRINPSDVIEVTSSREANPVVTEGNLSIATFNVLNYFNGEVDANGDVTFDYDENRGADDEVAFELQQGRIIEAIVNLNADVVGLMEIENDGFGEDSAIQSLVTAINAELGETEQYSFIATSDGSEIGTDAITVGLLYKATVVTPENDAMVVAMPEQQIDEDSLARMRPSLLQSFVHTESSKSFLVAVNHFKSKGSQCAEDVAEAPSEITTIQGSCNALRVSAAITLGNALSDESLPERKVILGDLNAYSAEDPVAVLTDYTPESRGYTITTAVNTGMDEGSSVDVESSFGYHNLAEEFDAEGFSYWFYGTEQVGSLDHVLASEAMLADAIDGAHWNINSVEAYQLQYDQALRYYPDEDGYAFTDVGPFRSSDHDPFIATFDLQADVVEEEEEENNDSSGGAMGGILALLAAAIGFRRRSTTAKK
ncbi:MAG: ExeM/NucH family extracellular endonuclease, partial [Alteromonas macleodii]|nr:ExeM/NucH family extracellular endonuclease [Alteromonas macleodii]